MVIEQESWGGNIFAIDLFIVLAQNVNALNQESADLLSSTEK